jgi:sigma-B regulation protein RsbU (phosphoserine phosphatase)
LPWGDALYGLGGEFAVFVVTSRSTRNYVVWKLSVQLSAANWRRTWNAAKPCRNRRASRSAIPAEPSRVCAYYDGKPLPLCSEFRGASLAFPGFVKGTFQDLVRDHERLHLRVGSSLQVGSNKLTVVTSEPFDKELVGKIAEGLGEITLYTTGEDENPPKPQTPAADGAKEKTLASSAPKQTSGFVISTTDNQRGAAQRGGQRVLHPAFTVGSMPESTASFDREITFGTPLPVVDWDKGTSDKYGPVLQVTTRPAVLYSHLFAALGEFVRGVTYILMGVAIFFAIIELIALIIGTRMTRTVTAAVADLHVATRHVDRGDFSHRIPVKSSDQLSDLARSFNSMTASIEKLMLEQREKQRLENELAIAQEVQAQLFPRQVSELESLEVHGFCRPARTVSGDCSLPPARTN